jgi:hypothetical protein
MKNCDISLLRWIIYYILHGLIIISNYILRERERGERRVRERRGERGRGRGGKRERGGGENDGIKCNFFLKCIFWLFIKIPICCCMCIQKQILLKINFWHKITFSVIRKNCLAECSKAPQCDHFGK